MVIDWCLLSFVASTITALLLFCIVVLAWSLRSLMREPDALKVLLGDQEVEFEPDNKEESNKE